MDEKKTPRKPSDRTAYGPERRQLVVELGKLLKDLREHKGMTTRGLAVASGVPQSTVMRYEYGDREPRIYNLVRMMRALRATGKIADFLKKSADILPEPPTPVDTN